MKIYQKFHYSKIYFISKLFCFYIRNRTGDLSSQALFQTELCRKSVFIKNYHTPLYTYGRYYITSLLSLIIQLQNVGLPGFEPRTEGPKSSVLPLHHRPILIWLNRKFITLLSTHLPETLYLSYKSFPHSYHIF